MLLVLVHLRCVDAISTGGLHHPRERSCAGLGHHCALAATVPNDPALIDGAREALLEAVASACLVVSGRCEGCASCISLYCDSKGLNNTHQGRRAAHERSARPIPTKSSHQKIHTLYFISPSPLTPFPFTYNVLNAFSCSNGTNTHPASNNMHLRPTPSFRQRACQRPSRPPP